MDEQPRTAQPRHQGRPKFFSNVNGVIAGITGLVIAVGGLLTAYAQFVDKPAGQAVAAAPVPAGQAAQSAAASPPSPRKGSPSSTKARA